MSSVTCPKGHGKFMAELRTNADLQTFHLPICPSVLSHFSVFSLKVIPPPPLLGRSRWHFTSPSCALSALTATWDVLSLPWKQNHESFSQEMPPNCLHFVWWLFLGESVCTRAR